jgi:TolB-like protein/DNA-binding winged helix-turn-helix (wHTH) protein/Tfp pilus assembly protein PilF
MPEIPFTSYRFERFTAEPRSGRLLRDGEAVAVEPKVFLILLFLLENRHRLVEKQEILDVVWHDAVVTENALTRAVTRLRKILGDDPRAPRFLETAHGRGYRFLADVETVAAGDESAQTIAAPKPPRAAARKSLVIAVAGLALLALTWQRFGRFGRGSTPAVEAGTTLPVTRSDPNLDPHRVAVLPIVDLSGQGDDAYFVDGLTEQLISTLSRIEGLRVLPRTTVMAYKGIDQRIAEIGRELGAGTVLEGSVRRSGEQLRITVQQVDVEREQTLWSAEFDRPLHDVFAIQSEVAVRVAEALQASIAPAALRRIERGPTSVIGAWDSYLKGRQFHRQRDRVGLASAVEHYRRALELDPDFALALAHLASAQALQALTVEEPPGWPADAVAAAERALELDPEIPTAYGALGMIAYYQDHFQQAFDYSMKAVELDPESATALYNASSFAQVLGRLDESVLLLLRSTRVEPGHQAPLAMWLWELGFEPQARELARQVLEEEPLTIYLNLYLAQHEMLESDFAAARERLQRQGRAYPLWPNVWNLAAQVEVLAGRPDAALELLQKASETSGGDNPEIEVRLAQLRWLRGEREEALRTLDRCTAEVTGAIERGSDSWVLRWHLAAIEAVRGNPDQAVRWLAESVDLGHYHYPLDESDPLFESLRDDPRFRRQLERMREKVATMRERLVRELGPDLSGLPA